MYYGDFMLFDEAGKLEKGERVFLGDVKGRNEGWLRDTLFKNPEIIPVSDIDPTFGPSRRLGRSRSTTDSFRPPSLFLATRRPRREPFRISQ